MIRVTLAKSLDRAIKAGAPWIYRDALRESPPIDSGTLVEVGDKAGRLVATAYWDARSPIAARVIDIGAVGDVKRLLRDRLREALARRRAKLDLTKTDAFRWVHGEADRLPGLHVDLYGDVAVIRLDGEGATAFYAGIAEHLHATANPIDLRAVVDRAAVGGKSLLGEVPAELIVRENGLLFEVAPGRAGKGGLFLDQRDNRAWIEHRARGRYVLNLFGYTGAFSLYAARGGALSTDTVDVAKPALEAAKRNFERNKLAGENHRFHAQDAFEFLQEAIDRGDLWDLVISDPPSFAPNRKSLTAARSAYDRLHRMALAVTSDGGTLCAASCSSHFRKDDLIASLGRACETMRKRWTLGEVRGAGEDHPVVESFPEGDYLKFMSGVVGRAGR